jgi:hypothetical protein
MERRLRRFRHGGAKLQALRLSRTRLIIARPPPAQAAASDHLVSNTSHRVDGSVLLACKPTRGSNRLHTG